MRMKQHKHLLCPRHQVIRLCQQCPLMIHQTEPATSLKVMEVPVQRWAPELQLPTLEQGPREEPERFATRYILNDGTMTQEAHDALLRRAAQAFNNQDMERELDNAMAREHAAHERSVREWEARIAAQELRDHPGYSTWSTIRQELRLCEHFQMSMQHFVRMTPLRLHILNQSSRRLRHLWEGRCQQASILTRNLQGLVHLVQPPPPATSRPDAA